MRLGARRSLLLVAILAGVSGRAVAVPSPEAKIAAGARAVLVPQRAGADGVLTVSAGGIFVQCLGRARSPIWRCEAAGFEGQSWLTHVLTPDRQALLIARGFEPDRETGNFVRNIPRTMTPETLASLIAVVLQECYGVAPGDIDVYQDWLRARRCHLRLSADNVDGRALVTLHYGLKSIKYASSACGIVTHPDSLNYDDRHAVIPGAPVAGAIDLDARYGAAIAAELARVEGKRPGENCYAIFGVGIAYIQCLADLQGQQMYCEAASDDAVGLPLARILTPARKQKLIEAGFAPPGSTMNYSRFFSFHDYNPTAIAHTLLAVLRDAYGYRGAPELMLTTDASTTEHPLLPHAKKL